MRCAVVVLLLILRMVAVWSMMVLAGWNRAGIAILVGGVVLFWLIGGVALTLRRAWLSYNLYRSTGSALRDIGGVLAAEERRFFARDVVFSVLSCSLAFSAGSVARTMLAP
jgi:archaellum biogenesis protein FlaJ (TadC family)